MRCRNYLIFAFVFQFTNSSIAAPADGGVSLTNTFLVASQIFAVLGAFTAVLYCISVMLRIRYRNKLSRANDAARLSLANSREIHPMYTEECIEDIVCIACSELYKSWNAQNLDRLCNYVTDTFKYKIKTQELARWQKKGIQKTCRIDAIDDIRVISFNAEQKKSKAVINIKSVSYFRYKNSGKIYSGSNRQSEETLVLDLIFENGWKINKLNKPLLPYYIPNILAFSA